MQKFLGWLVCLFMRLYWYAPYGSVREHIYWGVLCLLTGMDSDMEG